jgi:hypothetical protein
MTGYLIFWCLSLVGLAGFVGYWVRRIDRGHRERMASIEAAAAADRARFEAHRTAGEVEARLRELAGLRAAETDLERALFGPTWDGDTPPGWTDEVTTSTEPEPAEGQGSRTSPGEFANGGVSRPPVSESGRPGQ